MRSVLLTMIITSVITTVCQSQQWQTSFSLDSRVGYSTNSYLNPFLAEWNPELESGYNLNALTGRTYWYRNKSSFSLTGGILYELLFDNQSGGNWKGGLGLMNYNYRFTDNISGGIEAGASYLGNTYSRTLTWVQPKITWFVSPYTLLRLKAGSNFRNYRDYPDSPEGYNRYDLYAFEFETWPGYRWQLRAGLYGGLNTLPSIRQGFNARAAVGYHFRNGASLRFMTGLEQYRTEITEPGGDPPGGGFPPAGGPSATEINSDRMLRFGINGSLPLNRRFTIFASAEGLRFSSETTTVSAADYQVSGGIRLNFEPKIGNDENTVTPGWDLNGKSQRVHIHYSGEGRLYLVGDFNNWDKTGIPLRKQSDNSYVAQLSLPAGAYEYKVLRVLGDSEAWFRFSDDVYTVDDGFGSENAMLLVE